MASILICDLCDEKLRKGFCSEFTVKRKNWWSVYTPSIFGNSYTERLLCCDDCIHELIEASKRRKNEK